MPLIKQLDLLDEVKKRHPDGIIEGRKRAVFTILDKLGGKDFRSPAMLELLKDYWQPTEEDILYIINLEGIYVLTPSASKILLESASNLAYNCKKPLIFTNVNENVIEILEFGSRYLNPPILWAVDSNGHARLVGEVPNKFQQLLQILQEKGPASASQLAKIIEGETSKKAVGNISVYLQKLFNASLVGREKVTALEREDAAERGWTYVYQAAPTIQQNSSSHDYIRKP